MNDRYSIEYWNNFYNPTNKFDDLNQIPSQFAAFVLNEYISKRNCIDIGCGGGRDTFFFAMYGRNAIGVDASLSAIKQNNIKAIGVKNISFQKVDFASQSEITEFSNNLGSSFDNTLIYSRFFLHAIEENVEDNFISFCISKIKLGSIVCLEYRTVEDSEREKFTSQHYRRFVSPVNIKNKFLNLGAKLIYETSGVGMAKYKNDDAHVCRMIFGITYD
jgi:tellurite methyltransferase